MADYLLRRLDESPVLSKEESFSAAYQRDRLCDETISALENAGRGDEIMPLCEQEVKTTDDENLTSP